jgi:hypothetical protein
VVQPTAGSEQGIRDEEGMMGRIAENMNQLALAMGVSRTAAMKWVRRGLPKKEDGTFDVDEANEWLSKNVKPRPQLPKGVKQEVVSLAVNTRKTPKQIAEITGVKRSLVNQITMMVRKYMPGLNNFKDMRTDVYALEEMRYMDFITDKKLKNTSARDLASMAKAAWEKDRIQRGQATDNVAVIVKYIRELKVKEENADS